MELLLSGNLVSSSGNTTKTFNNLQYEALLLSGKSMICGIK